MIYTIGQLAAKRELTENNPEATVVLTDAPYWRPYAQVMIILPDGLMVVWVDENGHTTTNEPPRRQKGQMPA